MGVPVVASRTSPTEMAVGLAEQLGITVVGYVRPDALNLYAGDALVAEAAELTVPDYAALRAEWEEAARPPARALARSRSPSGRPSSRAGPAGSRRPHRCRSPRTAERCRASGSGGCPCSPRPRPSIAPARRSRICSAPSMERLVADGAGRRRPLHRFAEAWDEGASRTRRPAARGLVAIRRRQLQDRVRLPARSGAFLGLAALRPALETCTSRMSATLPDGVWMRGVCPWCGGPPVLTAIWSRTDGDGSPVLSAAAPGSRRGCAARSARAGTRATSSASSAKGVEEGYFIEACRACQGYREGRRPAPALERGLAAGGGLVLAPSRRARQRQGFWRADAVPRPPACPSADEPA